MPDPRCLNCDAPLPTAARFCPACGQRADTGRLTFVEMARDLMHSFVNLERGPLAFAWALLTRPGEIARDHVDGKRRRHPGPFATLTVVLGATTLAINLSGYQVLARDGFGPVPTDLLQRHFNLLILAQLPLLGGACALLFRAARLNLIEHMVLAAYTLGVRAVLLLAVIPIEYATASATPSPAQVLAFWTLWHVYFGWAASRFYRGPRLLSAVKGALAAALAHGAVVMIVLLGGRVHQSLQAGLAGN